MALTKRELSELVRDLMSGGDPIRGGKFHDTIIWKLADVVLGGLIQEEMWKNRQNNGYEINGSFLTTSIADVLEDKLTEEKYCVLEHGIIALTENRGIHRVSEIKNVENAFVQIPNGGRDIFAGLDAHHVNKKTEFYQDGNTLKFRNLGLIVEKVAIKQIATITGLDPDSPIAIPATMEDLFVQRIIDRLNPQKATPQDKNNDSNPNLQIQ